jgi:hypothetical protein
VWDGYENNQANAAGFFYTPYKNELAFRYHPTQQSRFNPVLSEHLTSISPEESGPKRYFPFVFIIYFFVSWRWRKVMIFDSMVWLALNFNHGFLSHLILESTLATPKHEAVLNL